MNKYNVVEFTFRKLTDVDYYIDYTVKKPSGEVFLTKKEQPYRIRSSEHALSTEEVAARVTKVLQNSAYRDWKLQGRTRFICMNNVNEQPAKKQLNMPQIETPCAVTPNTGDGRVYEVVKQGTVWTIVKRSEPLYTTEQAKTILFQRIVNE